MCKRPLPRVSGLVRSLKVAAADMNRYMDPTASISDILQKLMVIFRTVASFNVLMQKFYKVTQGNHKKSALIYHKARGDFKSNPVQMPQTASQLQGALAPKGLSFPQVCKHIQDSISYLHRHPKPTYCQLMVTTCKAESEMEEAKDKVRARSAVTTEVVDGSKEMSNQITKLMAALTRAEQGLHPVSAPSSPRNRGHGRGRTDRKNPTHPSSHNGQTGLGQNTSAHSSSASSRISIIPQGRGNTQGPSGGQGAKDPNSLQCFQCQGWSHMARDCATPANMFNKDRGN